ncbi:MAG: hypothetical protein J7L38_02945 [Thermoproteales archaeon]|nr:hypothetical protein [Thermoproteales archaeon]
MRKYGLDKHKASTHLVALRGIERHTTIQKTTSQRFIPHSFMETLAPWGPSTSRVMLAIGVI